MRALEKQKKNKKKSAVQAFKQNTIGARTHASQWRWFGRATHDRPFPVYTRKAYIYPLIRIYAVPRPEFERVFAGATSLALTYKFNARLEFSSWEETQNEIGKGMCAVAMVKNIYIPSNRQNATVDYGPFWFWHDDWIYIYIGPATERGEGWRIATICFPFLRF